MWFLAIALLAALPALTASAHDAPLGDAVTITVTPIETLEAPREWTDAQGIYHVRGEVRLESVSGDITGTATTTFNDDDVLGECNEESCEGAFYSWVDVDIDTDDGGWSGRVVVTGSFSAEGEEFTVRGILTGRGANGGQAILLDEPVGFGEDESVTMAGHLLTQSGPVGDINLRYDLCFAGPGSAAGGFVMNGPAEGSGSASATFGLAGAPAPGAIYGDIVFASERGEIHGTFVEFAIDGGGNIGAFVLTGGTGDYEGLYGFGKVIENVSFGAADTCDGAKGYWIGEVYGS